MLGLVARMQLWQQVALTLKSGLTVDKALAQAAATPGPGASIARRLRATGEAALADAAARCPEAVPAIDEAVLRAGEMSGKLPEALLVLVERLGRRRERLARLMLRLAYPVLIVHLCAVVGSFSQGAAGEAAHGFWPGLALALLPFYVLVAVPFLLPALLRRAGPAAALAVDAFILRVPFIGRGARWEAEAEFLWLLGTMLQAGIGLREALGFAAGRVSNHALRAALQPVAAAVMRGEPFGESLMRVPYLSAQAVSRIATAEAAGSLPEVLLLLAEEAKTTHDMGRTGLDGAIIGFFCLLMAGYAMWAILGFWSRYYGALFRI